MVDTARPRTVDDAARPEPGLDGAPTAQIAMVMNLDKCTGCHTCSVTCKQAWTNRSGVEYVTGISHDWIEAALDASCSLDYEGGPGVGGGPFGAGSGIGLTDPVAVENFHALRERQTADEPASGGQTAGRTRVNLLNWDRNGRPEGLFPVHSGSGTSPDAEEER